MSANKGKIAEIVLIVLCIAGASAFAIYVPYFKPRPTDIDLMCAGACLLGVVVCVRELRGKVRR